MEFDHLNKYGENLQPDQIFFHGDHPTNLFSSKQPIANREEFTSLDMLHPFSSSSKVNYLQEFNNLDQQFNLNLPTTNQMLGSFQSSCLPDPFDQTHFNPVGLSEGLQSNFDMYESKPFLSSTSGGAGGATWMMPSSSLMENFQGGGVGILDQNHPPIINPSPMFTMLGSLRSRGAVGGSTIQEYGINHQPVHKFRTTDEGSCSTAGNIFRGMSSNSKPLSTVSLITKRGKGKKKKSNVVKGQWTVEEDRLLVELVERYGVRKWSQIAQMLNGRIGKQCRERWHNHLRPDIKKDIWSEEEDKILIEAHAEIGNKWAEIAKRLPGRTENSIKNHWNATKRRQFSRRKCRSKYPRQSSLLQDYIKTLNLETINAGCRKKSSVITTTTNNNNNKVTTGEHRPAETSRLREAVPPAGQITQLEVAATAGEGEQVQASGGNDNNGLGQDDGLVPNYDDFGEVPDFNFDDDNLFEESSLDSFLNDVDSSPGGTNGSPGGEAVYDVDRNDQMEVRFDVMNSSVDVMPAASHEVKKELDLVEMINQVNL